MTKYKIISLIDNNRRVIVLLFFAVYLLIGIKVFTDYGVSWDEKFQRTLGKETYSYIVKGNKELLKNRDRHYGSIFEVTLIATEKILHLQDSSDICFARHLANFLIFYLGVFFFYRLCKYHFGDWKAGLLGALFLVLSPRLFAHSFYNPKDIPFLAMFIISIYTLLRYLDKRTLGRIFFHALACALLIDLRVIGVIVPFFTVIFVFSESIGKILLPPDKKQANVFLSFALYAGLLVLLTILFWPILWQNPLSNFMASLKLMTKFPVAGKILYLGNYIEINHPPWHYTPVWIAVSTPLVYLVLFLIGLAAVIKNMIFSFREFYRRHRDYLIFLLWLFFPMTTAIIYRPTLYNSWRHMFFIYPAVLLFALKGVTALREFIKIRFTGGTKCTFDIAIAALITINLAETAWFMAVAHPYQDIYFNALAGKPQNIKNNFEVDYWGLSYRQGLEYIMQTDKRNIIKICAANYGGKWNYPILLPEDRQRIRFVDKIDEADYFISNYSLREKDYPLKNEYYSLTVNGLKIMSVYRL